MKVRALDAFYDLVEERERARGEVFECSEGRYEEIAARLPGWVEAVVEDAEDGAPSLGDLAIAQLRSLIAGRGGTAPRKATKADLVRIAEGL